MDACCMCCSGSGWHYVQHSCPWMRVCVPVRCDFFADGPCWVIIMIMCVSWNYIYSYVSMRRLQPHYSRVCICCWLYGLVSILAQAVCMVCGCADVLVLYGYVIALFCIIYHAMYSVPYCYVGVVSACLDTSSYIIHYIYNFGLDICCEALLMFCILLLFLRISWAWQVIWNML